jgi:hypothetical protein
MQTADTEVTPQTLKSLIGPATEDLKQQKKKKKITLNRKNISMCRILKKESSKKVTKQSK